MGIEAELKYVPAADISADDVFGNELVLPFRGEIRRIEMHTRYLDTTDGLARKNGLALRVRTENGISVYTAKCGKRADGALSVRSEWNVPGENTAQGLDGLEKAGAPCAFLKGQELLLTSEIKFTRLESDVTPRMGFSFALSYDEGFFGKDKPFSEIELELKKGTEEDLENYGKLLSEKLSLRAETRSKFVRAMEYGK